MASPALAAAPTQQDVFRSIQDNVNDSGDATKLLPFLLAGAAVVLLVAVVSQRRKREARPRGLNHHGKLIKEVMKTVPLRKAELRQLKVLAEGAGSDPPPSPLTMALCPSLLARSIRVRQGRRGKLDRKAVSHLARKVGLTREMLGGKGAG